MKHITTILALCALTITSFAADVAAVPWMKTITVAPVAVLQTEGLNGKSTLGAGLDVGVGFNQYVSAHLAAYTYETDNWRGGAVDEIEAYGQGKISLAKIFDKQLSLTGKGGAVYDPAVQDYALAVGAGASLALSKSVSIGADYTVRAWFQEREKDSLARAFLGWSF